jgi:hypothetical protein
MSTYTESQRKYYKNNRKKVLKKQNEYNSNNREKYRDNSKRFYKNNKDYYREWRMRHSYGFSIDEYNNMFKMQNGCCAICKTHQSELKKSLSVDHCHKTGKVRGLLCDSCNRGIGLLKDDPKILQIALEYLK